MVNMATIFKTLEEENVREVLMSAGAPLAVRLRRGLKFVTRDKARPDEVKKALLNLRQRSQMINAPLKISGSFSVGIAGVGRLQVVYLTQRGSYSIIIKKINEIPPSFKQILDDINQKDAIVDVINKQSGLVLIISPQAFVNVDLGVAIISYLIQYTNSLIYTIESPISYVLRHELSIIIQQEVGQDTKTYAEGIQFAKSLAPDVSFVAGINTDNDMSALLALIELGRLVIVPVESASVPTGLSLLERMAKDPVMFRSTFGFFLRTIYIPELLENGKLKVQSIMIDEEKRNLIREGNYNLI